MLRCCPHMEYIPSLDKWKKHCKQRWNNDKAHAGARSHSCAIVHASMCVFACVFVCVCVCVLVCMHVPVKTCNHWRAEDICGMKHSKIPIIAVHTLC